jgi:hypothetical protein
VASPELIEKYREAIAAGEASAPEAERALYALHREALGQLVQLIAAGASEQAIGDLIATERRAFGWSYLSGELGERTENAFQAVASALEGTHG